jgi:nucleoside-diphosphate-sugar epimerase
MWPRVAGSRSKPTRARAEHFIVAAGDTVMNRPSRELMAEVYPSVPYRPTAGDFDTPLSIQKARSVLGYEPQWSWRDHITDA